MFVRDPHIKMYRKCTIATPLWNGLFHPFHHHPQFELIYLFRLNRQTTQIKWTRATYSNINSLSLHRLLTELVQKSNQGLMTLNDFSMVPLPSNFRKWRPTGGRGAETINTYIYIHTNVYVLLIDHLLYPFSFTAKLPALFSSPHGKNQLSW